MAEFGIKDSGARATFESGMTRDVEDDKIDWTLVFDGPMLRRYAEHLTKGAKKYSPRNWMKASGEAEYDRFKRSLLRHLVAYLSGETDEDHAAAVIFNLNGMEYVKDKPKVALQRPVLGGRRLTESDVLPHAGTASFAEQDASLDTYEDGTPRAIGLRMPFEPRTPLSPSEQGDRRGGVTESIQRILDQDELA